MVEAGASIAVPEHADQRIELTAGPWWPPLLAQWWHAQVDPAFEMPANGRFVDRSVPAR